MGLKQSALFLQQLLNLLIYVLSGEAEFLVKYLVRNGETEALKIFWRLSIHKRAHKKCEPLFAFTKEPRKNLRQYP